MAEIYDIDLASKLRKNIIVQVLISSELKKKDIEHRKITIEL